MTASLRGSRGKEKLTYRCGRYTNYGKEACASHNIREEVLEAIVLNDIRSYANLAASDCEELKRRLLRGIQKQFQHETGSTEKQLSQTEREIAELNSTVKSLYKDKLSGKIPETFFFNLLGVNTKPSFLYYLNFNSSTSTLQVSSTPPLLSI